MSFSELTYGNEKESFSLCTTNASKVIEKCFLDFKYILKVQIKRFFIAEFERAAKSQEDRHLPFLSISSSFRVTKV